MSKVKIKTIEIEIGKKLTKLSIEEAKALKDALDELFGQTVIQQNHYHERVSWPYIWYTPPVVPQRTFEHYEVTCQNNTAKLSIGGGAMC